MNTSPVFAKEAGELPVIGGLARILIFRSYETEKDDIALADLIAFPVYVGLSDVDVDNKFSVLLCLLLCR